MPDESPERAAGAGENPALAAALEYAERGWAVFPLDGKVPRTPQGLKDATSEPQRIAEWWRRWPDAGVAIVTGSASRLLVLDVDPEHGGDDTLAELEREHGELPETVRAVTGGGGAHYFFADPGGLRNTAGRLGPGLDTRAEGGYVVAPPSPHASGRRYEWDVPPEESELAAPPAGIVELLSQRRNGNAAKPGEPIPEGRRNPELASLAGTMRRRGMEAAAIEAALHETNAARCSPPLPEEEVARIAASVARYEPSAHYEPTDLGNAELFCALHSDRLRHIRERRQWITWQRGRWRVDRTGEAERAAKSTAREMLLRSADLEGESRERAAKWALHSQSEGRVRAMLTLAATEPEMALAAEELDADPYLLACGNGILDLRTAELAEPDPAALISLGTEVEYDPDAECPRWERFLEEVSAGDRELIGFLRRHAGYCLTGDVVEHVLAVFHGAGRNGKSTYVETMKGVLGDLATTASFDTFARARGDRGPRNDLARLHRARLVTASEGGAERRLDEATIKEITGGDTVAARFLYAEHFEYRPQFKLVLISNHRPRVDGGDDAMWARLRLVPFEQCFLGREDPELGATLKAELPGILRWAVEGCLEWQRDGLGTARAVDAATSSYRKDEDVLGAFLSERCTVGSGEVPTGELREAYEGFCEDLGEKPLSAGVLGRQLARRGIERGGAGRRFYQGVAL